MIRSWKVLFRPVNQRPPGPERFALDARTFDRLVRDDGHFANSVRYLRRNPSKAQLRPGESLHYESDLARSVE